MLGFAQTITSSRFVPSIKSLNPTYKLLFSSSNLITILRKNSYIYFFLAKLIISVGVTVMKLHQKCQKLAVLL
jgi:hypothetical protein